MQNGCDIDGNGTRAPDILAQGPCRRVEGMTN